jgi:hypothetical protein
MSVTNKKIKIGLIIDEFFGAVGTAYGGYGFLARGILQNIFRMRIFR